MSVLRMTSADTGVRLDMKPDQVDLVLSIPGPETTAVVLTGSVSSVLMLVDRINDRVHHLRTAHEAIED